MKTEIPEKSYEKLLKEITGLYGDTQHSMLKAYWLTGKYIIETEQETPARAGYGKYLIERLSNDLTKKYGNGFSKTNLKNMRRFFKTHPDSQPVTELEWSKYLTLLVIKDEEMREQFVNKAIDEELTRFQLKKQVELYMFRNRKECDPDMLENYPVERGELYCYRKIEKPDLLSNEKEVIVDCGFNVWRRVTIHNIDKYRDMEIFKTDKRNNRYYISEVLDKTEESIQKNYTYKGRVEKVIDGDTLQVNIDLGFDAVIKQKIRLRGVDTPEIEFNEGKKAKAFVSRELNRCEYIIIKTYKTDIYDRYISDVFYKEDCTDAERIAQEGTLLNRKLLEKGLARAI
ncbi:MAG: hypothetical protein GXY14_03390 [Spirochaetes bacterium]|nr:hypothetical protein [Spirochaetota bacterium]